MSVVVTYKSIVTVVETLPGNTDDAADANRKVTHSAFNEEATLNSGTTPPVTLHAGFVKALSTGTATIDLRTLNGTNGAALTINTGCIAQPVDGAVVDGNGLKVQIVRVKNLGANTLTIKSGASTGHTGIFTATTGTVVPPGGHTVVYTNDNGDDIDATHKFWDLTGTASQTSEWSIEMG